jgi:hypothetical protein
LRVRTSKLPRRRVVVPLTALLLVLAVVVVVIVASNGGPSSAGVAAGTTATGATTVQRRNLVATDTESGTLSYADPQTVFNRLSGTITSVPDVGQVIKAGQTLFTVDNRPVLLMDGSTPAYRDLTASDYTGPDIYELNRNLVDLGYDPDGIVIDDTWQAATTAGVEQLQDHLGQTQTGTLTLGQVVFLPGPQMIQTVDTTVGSTGGSAASYHPGSGSSAEFVDFSRDSPTEPSTTGTDTSTTGTDTSAGTTTPPSTSTGTGTTTTGTTTTGTTSTTSKSSTTPKSGTTPSSSGTDNPSKQTLQELIQLVREQQRQLRAEQHASKSPDSSGKSPSSGSKSPSSAGKNPSSGGSSNHKPDTGNSPKTGNTGSTGGGGSAVAVLGTSSTKLVVTIDLDASLQSEATIGEKVTVEMPNGSTQTGRVTAVSPVAQSSSSSDSGGGAGAGGGGSESGSGSSTVPVTVELDRPAKGGGLDQASVSVNFVQSKARNVLSVPVTALLATSGSSFAVQEATAGHRLIPVRTGLFAAGYVEISGTGVHPGLRVTDSQG